MRGNSGRLCGVHLMGGICEEGVADGCDLRRDGLSRMEVFSNDEQKNSQIRSGISAGVGGVEELAPSTVLLVEDEPDVRKLTRTFLEHEGYRVFSSGDAERAVQMFRSVPEIDLLVTDVYLPGRSGWDLAQELKSVRHELPVLLISGGMLAEEQAAKLQKEGWHFLAKPFRLPDLLAEVHRILVPVEARRWRAARHGLSQGELMGGRE
jgi:two-component system, chemotaxis family, chemotaxis protein CheY